MTKEKSLNKKALYTDPVQLTPEGELYRQKLQKLHKFIEEQESPLIADLELAGFEVNEVINLKTKYKNYKAAIPILIKHMKLPYHENIGEMIAHALAVPEARHVWDEVVEEYKKTPDFRPDGINSYRKDALAGAVAGALPAAKWNEFIELVRDRRNGSSRIMMLEKIIRSNREDREELLEELSNDPDLAHEITEYRKRKAKSEKRKVLAAAGKKLH